MQLDDFPQENLPNPPTPEPDAGRANTAPRGMTDNGARASEAAPRENVPIIEGIDEEGPTDEDGGRAQDAYKTPSPDEADRDTNVSTARPTRPHPIDPRYSPPMLGRSAEMMKPPPDMRPLPMMPESPDGPFRRPVNKDGAVKISRADTPAPTLPPRTADKRLLEITGARRKVVDVGELKGSEECVSAGDENDNMSIDDTSSEEEGHHRDVPHKSFPGRPTNEPSVKNDIDRHI